MTGLMSKADRDGLIRVAKNRAKLAENDVDARKAILYAEAIDLLTAEFGPTTGCGPTPSSSPARRWRRPTRRCAPSAMRWGFPHSSPRRSASTGTLAARRSPTGSAATSSKNSPRCGWTRWLAKEAKVQIQNHTLNVEEKLILGGFETEEAREFLAAMPTVEALMPKLSIGDLGVTRWQAPEDAGAQVTTPFTPAQRKARKIRRVIAANPGASNREIAELAGCDHKTIAAYRAAAVDGEFPAIGGEIPDDDETPP